MWAEFRKFIMRGNVLDLAIGVIIGGGLWRDRAVAGQGHYHAADWPAAWQGRLF